MSTVWYKHGIYCVTEAAWQSKITESETLLTTCPNNAAHTVNITGAYILDSLSSNEVKLDQTSGGGFFTNHGRTFIAAACATGSESVGKVTRDCFDLDMQISILNGKFDAIEGMEDDSVDLRLVPKTDSLIGIITATGALGATGLSVYSTVFPLLQAEGSFLYLQDSLNGNVSEKMLIASATGSTVTLDIGLLANDGGPFPPTTTYLHCMHNCLATVTTGKPVKPYSHWIYLTTTVLKEYRSARWIKIFKDGDNYSQLFMISELDMNNARVHIKEPAGVDLDPANGTIYVQLFIKPMHNRHLQFNTKIELGQNVIGGSLQPRGVGVIAEYTRRRTTPIKIIYSYEAFM